MYKSESKIYIFLRVLWYVCLCVPNFSFNSILCVYSAISKKKQEAQALMCLERLDFSCPTQVYGSSDKE